MNRKDYTRIKAIFQSAIEIAPDERAAFLDDICDGNNDLRREVEKLLNSFESSYLEKPAIEKVAELMLANQLEAGQKIGRYRIVSKIGVGGMGEIYLAEDTRLKRQIALKILPPSLGDNEKSVRRFEREAWAASALNHPNILTVYEFGEHDGMNFITSEYVKGETLRARLSSGKALSVPEALDITLQVAAALQAAHALGIIHRDIKPENVMIRDDSLVKVLDFGLAKPTAKNETIETEDDTAFHSAPGMIMGTAGYMSPEQARGEKTDARTDIWSLGVILYEMLAGKPPFKAETASDTIVAILTREPPPIDNVPTELTRILDKTLRKDADERHQTVKDFLLDLDIFKWESALALFHGTDH